MNKRIKILYTIPNFDTAGSGKVVYDLVKGLDRSRFEPEICCNHSRGAFFKKIEDLGVKIHIFSFTTPYRPLFTLPLRVLKIKRFFKKNKFDIIHSWHWSSDFTEPLAAKLAGIPFVYTKKAMGWGNKAWRWRSKLSTKIIAINSDMMSEFFNEMRDKTEQIPLGVDTNHYSITRSDANMKDQYEIKEKDFIIVSIANLVPVKGIEVLLRAIKKLNPSNVKVFIIGDDSSDYGQSLKNGYQSDQVKFIGKQVDVRPFLAMADLFVIPTKDEGRKEGMPIAPLEAMSTATVVLGSNISGIKDILDPFPNCIFEPSNEEQLAQKIDNIMCMNDLEREKLGLEMRAYVENNLSLEKCISNHEFFYTNLVN